MLETNRLDECCLLPLCVLLLPLLAFAPFASFAQTFPGLKGRQGTLCQLLLVAPRGGGFKRGNLTRLKAGAVCSGSAMEVVQPSALDKNSVEGGDALARFFAHANYTIRAASAHLILIIPPSCACALFTA